MGLINSVVDLAKAGEFQVLPKGGNIQLATQVAGM